MILLKQLLVGSGFNVDRSKVSKILFVTNEKIGFQIKRIEFNYYLVYSPQKNYFLHLFANSESQLFFKLQRYKFFNL